MNTKKKKIYIKFYFFSSIKVLLFSSFLCVFSINHSVSQQIPTTYWYTKSLLPNKGKDYKKYLKLKNEGYRYDSTAWNNENRFILVTKNIKAIPSLLKKKKDYFSVVLGDDSLASANPFNILKRNQIRKQLIFQFDTFLTQSRYIGLIEPEIKEKNAKSYKKSIKKYKKDLKSFKKFLKSKSGFGIKDRSWYLDFGEVKNSNTNYGGFPAFQFGDKHKAIGEIHFDTINGHFLEKLLQVDTSDCTPTSFQHNFDYTLSKGKGGCGFMTNRNCFCSYRPYSKVKERKFSILFPYNKSTFTKKDIAPITAFLEDENRMIVKTKIEAYASVEGDKHRNLELQQQRANVLLRLLIKANRDSIESNIHTSENWDKFYKQIEKLPIKNWKNLSQDSIKTLLDEDSVKKKLEPILAPEREAILFVSFADRLTKNKKIELVKKHYDQALHIYHKYHNTKSKRSQSVYRMTGIRSYLKYAVNNGELEAGEACEILGITVPELDIISFYQEKNNVLEERELLCSQNTYDLIYNAYKANYQLIKESFADLNLQKRYASQGVDIQLFAYELISTGKLPKSLSDEIEYPYDQAFAALRINKLVFEAKDYDLFNTKKTEVTKARIKASFQEEDTRLILSSYNLIKDVGGGVYNFAKGIALYPNKYEIHNNFKRFYLSSILQMSISKWNEKEQSPDKAYFDKEIDNIKMKILLGRYLSKYACPVVQNQISLTYQRKAAYHSFMENNMGLKNETIKILSVIKSYYQKRIEKLSHDKIISLTRYFLRFNKESFDRKGLELALNFIEAAVSKKHTNKEIDNLYSRLVKIRN